MSDDMCECCKRPIGDDGYCNWEGSPFSQRASREICYTCVCALRPITAKLEHCETEVAFIGTAKGDVHTLSEMVKDGFDKKKARHSIACAGKVLGLPPSVIKKRLAN